jgi:hypothetical protein
MRQKPAMQHARAWAARALLLLLVAVAGLGPPTPTSAAEWVQNFAPTELWSGPDTSAISFGSAPQWDYFQVLAPQMGGRFYVLVARTGNYAFVDATSIGPSGPPPVGWPGSSPTGAPAPPARPTGVAESPAATAALSGIPSAAIGPVPGFPIAADQALWPALRVLQSLQHTWTLQALSVTSTRLEWGQLPPDAVGAYQPSRLLITLNVRWYRSDPRALAAIIEHEAKHVADLFAGMDVESPIGCIATEINAYREEAKTWGELVGPNGKPNPQDDLELSLNYKLSVYRQGPEAVERQIVQSAGYRSQCHVRA